MGQGACSGYLKHDFSNALQRTDGNNNSNMDAQKVAALEEKLRQKDAEIEGLRVSTYLPLSPYLNFKDDLLNMV